MDEAHRVGDVAGTIRRRLLANALVDPADVAPMLPARIRTSSWARCSAGLRIEQ